MTLGPGEARSCMQAARPQYFHLGRPACPRNMGTCGNPSFSPELPHHLGHCSEHMHAVPGHLPITQHLLLPQTHLRDQPPPPSDTPAWDPLTWRSVLIADI